jgi:hypothetical protein
VVADDGGTGHDQAERDALTDDMRRFASPPAAWGEVARLARGGASAVTVVSVASLRALGFGDLLANDSRVSA